MSTVIGLLRKMGACEPVAGKFADSGRAFKRTFINAHWSYGEWFGTRLFSMYPLGCKFASYSSDYPRLPRPYGWEWSHLVSATDVGALFRSKENRIKYWPEVKKRLKELGVKL